MSAVASSDTVGVLQYLHEKLDVHFRQLHEARKRLDPASPVFALEHGLGPADLDLLLRNVRSAVAQGLGARHRRWWLPFVVYAAESGYDYVGDEYWWSFEQSTPGWRDDQRPWIRDWFRTFADEYGGAVPTGAFARNFTIIAWPITHAVLPTYLQRQLAKLLFEFRTGLSSTLLDNPEMLGARLAVRATGYTERFRIFCQNTALLGQVAAALLSGDDEPTPYLVSSTLQRLVDGLSAEGQSKHWLDSARRSASRVRATGFKKPPVQNGSAVRAGQDRLPTATAPQLFLRLLDGVWTAYAELPDMTPLSARLPELYDSLRTRRALVTGRERPVAHGALVYRGQNVQFDTWPDPSAPFVKLEGATADVNALLADQCVMTRGPWWLFRLQGSGLAVEVRGRLVRPEHRYVLVGREGLVAPAGDWCRPVSISAAGVQAYEMEVPAQLTGAETAHLRARGISAESKVAVRPVGMVASAWDGEGAVEWLAGEPAIVGMHAELLPSRCDLTVDGEPYFVPWPPGELNLVLSLEGLDVGTHDVTATILGEAGEQLSAGSLVIAVRDPEVRPESAAQGEGIRILAAPARPSMAELWDERATVEVHGPNGTSADLTVSLRGDDGHRLSAVRRTVNLPVTEEAWADYAGSIRRDAKFSDYYDDAELCVLTVSRLGVGLASLTCERGFRPLRWKFSRARDGSVVAALHDRTDGGTTTVEYYDVIAPTDPQSLPSNVEIALPPRGGLLYARAGDSEALALVPTNPNAVLALGTRQPEVPFVERTPRAVLRLARTHRLWECADVPADPFAVHERLAAQEAIARAIAMIVCGTHWTQIERRLEGADDPADYLEQMQAAVGESDTHRALAKKIGLHLYEWLTPETLLPGFNDAIAHTLRTGGLQGERGAALFLLTLAGRPGYVADWNPADRDRLLEEIMRSPVLLRAARFAVLGARAINDSEMARQGF